MNESRELRRRTNRHRGSGSRAEAQESTPAESSLAAWLVPTNPSGLPYVPAQSNQGEDLSLELLRLTTREHEREPACILLTGQHEVGKTSALRNFRDKILAAADPEGVEHRWLYVDGKLCAAYESFDQQPLVEAILAQTAEATDMFLKRQGMSADDLIRESFREDSLFRPERLLDSEAPAERQAALVKEKFEDPLSYLEVCLRFLARRFGKGRVLLVLDNIDSLVFEFQRGAIEFAHRLTARCGIQAVISARRATARRLRFVDPEGIMHSAREIEARPPRLIDVIHTRWRHVMESERPEGDATPPFAQQILCSLSDPAVLNVLEPLSNGRPHEGLRLAAEILRSPEFTAVALAGGALSETEVLRALLLGGHMIYEPESSLMGNVFGTHQSDSHLGPFLRAHIVLLARQHGEDGILDERLYPLMRSVLDAGRDAIEEEVLWLLDQDWLERPELGRLCATPRGRLFVESFLYQTEYLMEIAADVDMTPESEGRLVVPAKGLVERIHNLVILIDYLVSREKQLFQHIGRDGLSDYIEIFGDEGLTYRMISRSIEAIGVQGQTAEAVAAREARRRLTDLQHDVNIPRYISTFGEE